MFEKHGRPIGRFEEASDKWNRIGEHLDWETNGNPCFS
jgi:hypothetical protein